MIKKQKLSLILITLILTMHSCAPEGMTYEEYGILSGIWHGICFPFALLGKLFGADVGIYASNNSGLFYWIGFIIGLGFLGGGGASSRR